MQVTDRPGATDLEDSEKGYDIELKDVTFGYRADQPILQVWCRAFNLLQELLTRYSLPSQGTCVELSKSQACTAELTVTPEFEHLL